MVGKCLWLLAFLTVLISACDRNGVTPINHTQTLVRFSMVDETTNREIAFKETKLENIETANFAWFSVWDYCFTDAAERLVFEKSTPGPLHLIYRLNGSDKIEGGFFKANTAITHPDGITDVKFYLLTLNGNVKRDLIQLKALGSDGEEIIAHPLSINFEKENLELAMDKGLVSLADLQGWESEEVNLRVEVLTDDWVQAPQDEIVPGFYLLVWQNAVGDVCHQIVNGKSDVLRLDLTSTRTCKLVRIAKVFR